MDKRRRRKLHGPSCFTMKEQMQKLSSVPLESLVETSDENAYLCSSCETQLQSVESLEDKPSGLKSEIRGMLSVCSGHTSGISCRVHVTNLLSKAALHDICCQDEESERLQPFLPHTPTQTLMSTSYQPLSDASPDV